MKQAIYTRIEKYNDEYFLDYSFDKKNWKNHSVQPTKEKCLKDIKHLKDIYCIAE